MNNNRGQSAARVLRLLALLADDSWLLDDLRDELQCSSAQLRRDINVLRGVGVPVVARGMPRRVTINKRARWTLSETTIVRFVRTRKD